MKKNILKFTIISACVMSLSACVNQDSKEAELVLSCSYPTEKHNGEYNVLFNIINENTSEKQSGSFFVKKDTKGKYEVNNSRAYFSSYYKKTKFDGEVVIKKDIKEVIYGLSISTSIIPDNTGINFTINNKNLIEFKTIGNNDGYIENPVMFTQNLKESTMWGIKKEIELNSAQKERESNSYFSTGSMAVKLPAPTKIQFIACPII